MEAVPLEALLARGATVRLRQGDHFAYGGAAYECRDPAACGRAVTALKAAYEADQAAARAPPAKGQSGVVTPPARANLAKLIRDELLGSGPTKGFAQTRATPKGSDAWAGLDAGDADALVKAGKGVACDLLRDAAGSTSSAALPTGAAAHLFRKGDVYCDGAAEPAKAWRCKDPLKCGEAAADPTGPRLAGAADAAAKKALSDPWLARVKTAAVTDAWEEVEQTALAGKLFVERPDAQAAQKAGSAPVTKAFDWTATTAATATGTYEFAPAALALDRERLWKCVGTKETCKATQPSADTDGKAWALTTLKGAAFTAAEAAAKQPAVVECFAWADGYPVQQGDVLCDPLAPSKRAWTCLDPLLCKEKPELKDAARLAAVWSLATEGSRADATGAVTRGLLLRFKSKDAPKEEGAPVQCEDWDDRVGTADLGAKLTWCDRGRVFRCVEAAVETAANPNAQPPTPATSTRACCSGTERPAAGAKLGCWRQARQRGTVAKKSAAEADARWGPAPAAEKCSANETFGAKGAAGGKAPAGGATAPAWSAAATSGAGKVVKYGALELKDGAACAEDAAW